MKKNFYLALMGAIALTGAVGLTACTDSDEVAEATPSPNYNPKTGEVLTNFVFNVSTNTRGTTRMSPANVQIGDNTFRGIQNALLLTYKLDGDGKYITSTSTTSDKDFNLDRLMSADEIKTQSNASSSSRRVLEMSLPVGTNTMLFWGRAIKENGKDKEQGNITFSPNTNLADASFKTNFCLTNDEKDELDDYAALIEKVLNNIINVKGTVTVDFDGDNTNEINKDMAWYDYVDFNTDGTLTAKVYDPSTYNPDLANNEKLSACGQILANLFIRFNTFKNEELRNGEGKITAALMRDIYDVAGSAYSATVTTAQEKAASIVAGFIQAEIRKYFDQTNKKWLTNISTIKTSAGFTSEQLTHMKSGADLNKFPNELFHLPPGAMVMKYVAIDENHNMVNEYSFMTNVPTYAMGSEGGSFDPKNYIYPAELCYFGNSPLRVTDQEHAISDYPNGTTNWDADAQWANGVNNNTVDWKKNGHVLSSTRSVAMQNNINYGTALLKTTITYATGITKLKDNNSGLHTDEADNTITITDDCLQLTGVLIGGQVQEVGWNYLAKGTPTFSYMVYDNQLPSTAIPTPNGKDNYTLVWDNWNQSTYAENKDQNTIYVALQFLNNTGKDFWGMNNIIRNGSTFYIVGKLDPDIIPNGFKIPEGETNAGTALSNDSEADKTTYKNHKSWGITWPTNYALPPYDADGKSIKQRRVFIQDYMTTAHFVLGTNSLKSALVSVPDLRSSQQTLGLSVDLQWSQGLEFENVTLGN